MPAACPQRGNSWTSDTLLAKFKGVSGLGQHPSRAWDSDAVLDAARHSGTEEWEPDGHRPQADACHGGYQTDGEQFPGQPRAVGDIREAAGLGG